MQSNEQTDTNGELSFDEMIEAAEEIQNSYAEYALHVIKQRALPDVRDGLKPAQRRVIYSMYDEGVFSDRAFKKSARIVGNCLGKFHPHGDQSVYETMVRMAQDFSLRYLLVDGHGNFGSIDGDNAAAPRYTEVRMAPLAMELIRDINEDTIDWQANYDESLKEPVVLPGRFPNLLVNGSDGIAVGMATKMPPHNLKETVNAINSVIDNPNITLKQLIKQIKGPDFPTGGIIVGDEAIKEYFETGQGKLTVRAKAHVEDNRGKPSIVITELPFQLTKSNLIEKIAKLVKEKKTSYLSNIVDLRDESDKKTGIRLVIETKRDTNPSKLMAMLFKETPLQQTYSVHNLCLVDNMPRTLTLRELIQEYIKFQIEVIVRRTNFRLEKVKARLHILEGYLIALNAANIDKVIAIIKKSQNGPAARTKLMSTFKLSEIQAQAVLDLRLQKLTQMDIKDIKLEHKEKTELKKELEAILKSEKRQKEIIKEDLLAISEKFGDDRKTEIMKINSSGEDIEESLEEMLTQIPEEENILLFTEGGYVKRMPTNQFRNNTKGSKGSSIIDLGKGDFIKDIIVAKTNDELWAFGDDGNVTMLMVNDVVEQNKTGRGRPIRNLLENVSPNIQTLLTLPGGLRNQEGIYVVTVSEKGMIKRTALEEYNTNRSSIIGFKTKPGDKLIKAFIASSSDNVVLTTDDGNTIHFSLDENVPVQGRSATGVIGIKLISGAKVIGAGVYSASNTANFSLLAITNKGFGKATNLQEYPITKRGGKGVKTATIASNQGKLVTANIINESELRNSSVYSISKQGALTKIKTKDFTQLGRTAKLTIGVGVKSGDDIASATVVVG